MATELTTDSGNPTTSAPAPSGSAAEVAARTGSLRTTTIVAGLVAAAVTTGAAAALHAAGVSFEIDGKEIPLLGFAQMTFLGAVIGGLLAWALRTRSAHPRRRFLQATGGLFVLTAIPSVTVPPETGTKLALVATHLIAAAIIVPVLARRLAD